MRDHFSNVSWPKLQPLDHTKATCPYPEDVVFDLMANGKHSEDTGNSNGDGGERGGRADKANGDGGGGDGSMTYGGGAHGGERSGAVGQREGRSVEVPAVRWLAHREFHPNETPPASGEACAAVIEDWAYEARGASGSLWCTYDIQHDDPTPFNTSLAMFLLGMEAHSYFGASAGYSDYPVRITYLLCAVQVLVLLYVSLVRCTSASGAVRISCALYEC